MPIAWRDVFSSHVKRVGHDSDTGEMVVEWKTGKTSAYEGVPADKVEEIAKSYSVGDAIRGLTKPAFKHRYRE